MRPTRIFYLRYRYAFWLVCPLKELPWLSEHYVTGFEVGNLEVSFHIVDYHAAKDSVPHLDSRYRHNDHLDKHHLEEDRTEGAKIVAGIAVGVRFGEDFDFDSDFEIEDDGVCCETDEIEIENKIENEIEIENENYCHACWPYLTKRAC